MAEEIEFIKEKMQGALQTEEERRTKSRRDSEVDEITIDDFMKVELTCGTGT